MSTAVLRRTAAGAALVLASATLLGSVATASEPRTGTARSVARLGTTLSIRVALPRPRPDGSDLITGRLRAHGVPLPRKRVLLLDKEDGATKWSVASAHRTRAQGRVRFVVRPVTGTSYRLAFLGNRVFRPSRSAVVHVAARPVVPAPSSLSIRGLQTLRGFRVAGSLRGDGHALVGRPVTLQAQAPGETTWSDVGTKRTRRHGKVAFVRPLVAGTSYRLAFAGGPRFLPCISGVVTS